jgi:hypothetical protein
MNTTTNLPSIPVLRWTAHRTLYQSADLPDGAADRINQVCGDGRAGYLRIGHELWLQDASRTTAGELKVIGEVA